MRRKGGLKTGFPALDRAIDIGGGIITLKSRNQKLLFNLSANIMVRNYNPDKKTLYLHLVDYHRRYWSMDYDFLSSLARTCEVDPEALFDGTCMVRAFSRDCAETEENWKMLFSCFTDENSNFAILDSISELYEENEMNSGNFYHYMNSHTFRNFNRNGSNGSKINFKTLTYTIGMFSKFCIRNNCVGIVLDCSRKPLHPYLGEVSSVVLEFFYDEGVIARLLKHPCLAEGCFEVRRSRQTTLKRFMH